MEDLGRVLAHVWSHAAGSAAIDRGRARARVAVQRAARGAVQIYSAIDISSDELALLRAPTLSPIGKNVLISRRASKTAAFDQTEVTQMMEPSGVAFAGARWGAHDTEIWVGQAVNQVEKPFVSKLR